MTPNRDFLIDFHKNNGKKSYWKDNGTCDVNGTMLVQSATHDGMIRKLTNMKYVHELKRNLIFFS